MGKDLDKVLGTFYHVPKVLFTSEKYKDLNLGAKLLYGVLWGYHYGGRHDEVYVDEEGCEYSIFTNKDLVKATKVHEKSIVRYKKDLEKHGIIKQKRLGLGQPNKLYIMHPSDLTE